MNTLSDDIQYVDLGYVYIAMRVLCGKTLRDGSRCVVNAGHTRQCRNAAAVASHRARNNARRSRKLAEKEA